MKSYLSLIPISARVHRRQNRMTLLCIIISVFLVTTIFSIAHTFVRAEGEALQEKHGSWHIRLDGISQDIGEEIRQHPDVIAAGLTFKPSVGQNRSIQTRISPFISVRRKLRFTAWTKLISHSLQTAWKKATSRKMTMK